MARIQSSYFRSKSFPPYTIGYGNKIVRNLAYFKARIVEKIMYKQWNSLKNLAKWKLYHTGFHFKFDVSDPYNISYNFLHNFATKCKRQNHYLPNIIWNICKNKTNNFTLFSQCFFLGTFNNFVRSEIIQRQLLN